MGQRFRPWAGKRACGRLAVAQCKAKAARRVCLRCTPAGAYMGYNHRRHPNPIDIKLHTGCFQPPCAAFLFVGGGCRALAFAQTTGGVYPDWLACQAGLRRALVPPRMPTVHLPFFNCPCLLRALRVKTLTASYPIVSPHPLRGMPASLPCIGFAYIPKAPALSACGGRQTVLCFRLLKLG